MSSDDRGAIQNLMYRYAELLDSADIDGLADLLSDAEIRSDTRDGVATPEEAVVHRGRDEIFAFYGGRNASSVIKNFLHVTTNSIIDIDEAAGTATARSYYVVYHAQPNGPLVAVVAGQYHDRFKRGDQGWRFAARTYTGTLASDALSAFRATSDADRQSP